jgi:hypothetical protein
MDLTKRELIKTISIIQGNLSYIEKTGKINGTLLIEIERVMEQYAQQEAKSYANWLSNQVIAGRTMTKLWNDYREQVS